MTHHRPKPLVLALAAGVRGVATVDNALEVQAM